MEKEIEIPEGVNVEVDGKSVKISGEKGQVERTFRYFHDIKIQKKDNKIVTSSKSEKRRVKLMMGTIIAHIRNMMKGVSKGFTYNMKVVYSHFPMNVQVQEKNILIKNFIGEKKPRVAKIMGENTQVKVNGKDITITGIDKEEVGQTMGNVEQACRIIGFDRRVFQDGIYFTGEDNG
ncbi:MAG: 50S ribosomal protein L6 [Candidatus Aenigmarchaeota archaeon]|nr:50S ribosomal protein L6 [Candidatus Aenigmarchaeota archaeon]